jgi:hypothetical protein
MIGSIYNIYDKTGKSVVTGKVSSKNTVIDFENLTAGIYYLMLIAEDFKQSFSVIKE